MKVQNQCLNFSFKINFRSYLYNPLIEINDTFILQEYFIPFDNFENFMKESKLILMKKFERISLLNITIRFVKEDNQSFLSYAQKDVLAFVLYFRIERSEYGEKEIESVHQELTKVTKLLKGTFYLPYRHHYSKDDLKICYPMIDEFFTLKNKHDKNHLFSNLWYENYAKEFYSSPINQSSQTTASSPEKTPFISNIQIHRENSYQKIFEDETLKKKFYEFLHTVFNLLPPKLVFGLYAKATWNPSNKTDLDVYKEVQDKLKKLSFLYSFVKIYKSFKQLITQKIELTREYHSILSMIGRIGLIDNYVCIGDSGKLIPKFKRVLKIKGNIYILHDKQRTLDYIEKGTILDKSKFIEFDLENIKENVDIPENSIDLITINQGLHHIPLNELPKFLQLVWKILRQDGIFIVREHDATSELIPLADVAHSTFNAITGVSIEEEQKEIRAFRTIKEWKEILTSFGFEDLHVMELQDDDPTEDYMICFRKPKEVSKINIPESQQNSKEENINEIKKYFTSKGKKLSNSNPASCHYRLPEWMIVRFTEEFGKFMNKEVFIHFPFLSFVSLYWRVYFKEFQIVSKRYGLKKATLEYGPMMNMFVGLIFSAAFIQIWIVALPFRLMTKIFKEGNEGPVEQMIISSKSELNLQEIDSRIKTLEMKPFHQEILYILQVPRHLPFNEICFKFSKLKEIQILEIGGISDDILQIELILKERKLLKEITVESFEVLFEFQYPVSEMDEVHVSISVKVRDLLPFIRQCSQIEGIKIKQIFDYLFK
jgi:SAM-dependent methyltransferase